MNLKLMGKLSWTLTLLITLLTCCGLAMLKGWGTDIQWHTSTDPKPADIPRPDPAIPAAAPLQTYSTIWSRSLFNQDRTADPEVSAQKGEAEAPPLIGVALIGVVISPPLHKAFLKTAEGASLSLNEGESLPSGWVIGKIQSERVSLSYKSTRQELVLPVLKVPAGSLR